MDLVEVARAGTGGAAGGVANPDWDVLHDPAELDLEVLLVLSQHGAALPVLHDRSLVGSYLRGSASHRGHRDQL